MFGQGSQRRFVLYLESPLFENTVLAASVVELVCSHPLIQKSLRRFTQDVDDESQLETKCSIK